MRITDSARVERPAIGRLEILDLSARREFNDEC
jgi:hypothetical protein